MATISEQIASIDATIATKTAQIAELYQSARDWRASKSQCAGTSKKRSECEAGKEATAVIRENNAKAIEQEISNLKVSKLNLMEAQKAENTIGIKLADQGISQASAIIRAEGEAQAAITASKIKSTAEATAITKESESSSLNKTAIIGIAGLLVVVVVIVVVKKYAGKNKVKSKP